MPLFYNRMKGIKMFCRYCQWCLGLCWWCSKMHARKRRSMWPCLRKLSKRHWWMRRWLSRLCSWWNVHQSLWCCTRSYCRSSIISGNFKGRIGTHDNIFIWSVRVNIATTTTFWKARASLLKWKMNGILIMIVIHMVIVSMEFTWKAFALQEWL